MGTSIVEKSLADMEQLIDEAKSVPFSTKTLMDTEELSRLIEDIRLNMPEEITQANEVVKVKLEDEFNLHGEMVEIGHSIKTQLHDNSIDCILRFIEYVELVRQKDVV